MKNFGKSLLIAFLMFLAIYQTGKLWFEGFSDHNFFSFLAGTESGLKDITYTMDRLVINMGDGKVICIGSNIYTNKYKAVFDKGIAEAVTDGVLQTGKTLNWNELLKNRAIIYEYNCSFAGADIGSLFDINAPGSEAINQYDRIILLPSVTKGKMEVIFSSSEENTAGIYTLTDSNIVSRCYNASSALNTEDSTQYISTLLNSFTIFSQNEFIPLLEDKSQYCTLESYSILPDNSDIERNADLFFQNTMSRSTTRSGGEYTFSDNTNVVKYYPNGKFEYSGYKAASLASNDFYTNYSAALAMLNKDIYVENEYYLNSYKIDETGSYSFSFNYKINGLSVVPGDEIKKLLGTDSFIEVTCHSGRVSKYIKYAYGFRELTSTKSENVIDYIAAIDSLYAKLYGDGQTKPVEKIRLEYIASGSRFSLQWNITVDGKSYLVPAVAQTQED